MAPTPPACALATPCSAAKADDNPAQSPWNWVPDDATLRRLRLAGLRLTTQRRIVLKALHADRSRFIDAETVLQATHRAGHAVTLASVYRVLAEFDKARVVQGARTGARMQYRALAGGEGAQPHFVCARCGHAEPLGDDALLTQLFDAASRHGFALSLRVALAGLCSSCQPASQRVVRPANPMTNSPSKAPISTETHE